MNTWFSASLLFRSVHQQPRQGEVLWEESIRLIQASTEEEAAQRAEALGKRTEAQYKVKDDKVRWTFVRIERVCEIDPQQLTDGTELFSRFLRDSEVESLSRPFED